MRLWRNTEEVPEGKYLVTRRDGSTPDWPYFVIGAKDPAAPAALRAYAAEARLFGMDPQYADDVDDLAEEFEQYRMMKGSGDPDGRPHRADDAATIEKMRSARGS